MNSTTNEGEKMEKQMWEDIKSKNWKVVESKIADGFQSVHPDGARDQANEISLIKSLNVGPIEFNDFKSTMSGDNVVVTYMISVQETIALERLPTKPTPRLSVWRKGAGGWQWICHTNLNPIPWKLSVNYGLAPVTGTKSTFGNAGRDAEGPIPSDISGR
jgi:hypothetical protein